MQEACGKEEPLPKQEIQDQDFDARKKELVLTEQGIAVQETVLERLNRLEDMANQALGEEERKLWFHVSVK